MAEYGQLDPAEARYFLQGNQDYEIYRREPMVSWPYYASPEVMGGPEDVAQVITVDTVPDQLPGEDEVSRGEHVHAKDGDIGHLQGIVVDPGTGRVISVLLREGHLLNRRTVLIPRSAVARVGADGFYLHITTRQVQRPAARGHRSPGRLAGRRQLEISQARVETLAEAACRRGCRTRRSAREW